MKYILNTNFLNSDYDNYDNTNNIYNVLLSKLRNIKCNVILEEFNITDNEINEYIKRKSLLEFINNGDFSKIKDNSKYSIYKLNRVIKLNNCYRINYGNYEREYCLSDEYLELANILNEMSLGGNNEQEENKEDNIVDMELPDIDSIETDNTPDDFWKF